MDIKVASQDLFFKLRNRFPKIKMGDENGSNTIDPEQARFFNFNYTDKISKREYGQVTCSLIDNNSLKVYFDTSITEDMLPEDKKYWFEFLRELRRMAKSHMLNLDVRDITKDVLNRQDLQFMTNQNPDKKSVTESKVLWRRRGKVSEGNLNNVRIHVVHEEAQMENLNNRLLRVSRIYLVNESGEKFLLPFKSMSGAKAMAHHVNRGGNPYDATGELIKRGVTEMKNLGRFVMSTRNRTFEAAEAPQVIEAAIKMKESIRGNLMRLSNNSRRWDESINRLTDLLSETEADTDSMKTWFTQNTYNETLDNYLPIAAMAYKKLQENLLEAETSIKNKIMDPKFRLVLKADPAMDKLLTSRKYANTEALLTAVLGDISNRAIGDNDDIANFASHMGDMISSEGEPFSAGKDAEYADDKKLAILLAQKYMKDLQQIKINPEYEAEVRQDPAARTKMKSKAPANTEGDEFEEAIMSMGEEEQMADEGNEFTGALAKAKADHKDEFEVDGKTYKVKEATKNTGDSEKSAVGSNVEESHCNMTAEGEYCPVHGMSECYDAPAMVTNSKEETMSEEIKRLSKLAGLTESYIYADEADSDEPEADQEQVDSDTDKENDHDHEDDGGEYDDEAGMAKDQLTHAEHAAKELRDLLSSDEDLPEWVQAKITKAADYLDMAYDTMDSRHEQGHVHKTNEALKGNQEKLDKNHNKKIDAEDFKIMRKDQTNEAKGKKPDFLDVDKDGDESEPMTKALKDKKDKEVKENIAWLQAIAGINTK